MTSELPASPSEIHADDTEIFQLKAPLLNFLRNTSEITDEHIPKLNPCHFCDKEILALPLHSFTVLSCEHIYHRICLEKHIELALAFGEYHMVSKNNDFRKKDPLSDDTIEDEDSLVGQEEKRTKVITHDQVINPIA
ncbi:19061_t:CDS:2, partial [Funneliformis geosporum]